MEFPWCTTAALRQSIWADASAFQQVVMQLTCFPNIDGGSCSFFPGDIAVLVFAQCGAAIKDAADACLLCIKFKIVHLINLHCDLEGGGLLRCCVREKHRCTVEYKRRLWESAWLCRPSVGERMYQLIATDWFANLTHNSWNWHFAKYYRFANVTKSFVVLDDVSFFDIVCKMWIYNFPSTVLKCFKTLVSQCNWGNKVDLALNDMSESCKSALTGTFAYEMTKVLWWVNQCAAT